MPLCNVTDIISLLFLNAWVYISPAVLFIYTDDRTELDRTGNDLITFKVTREDLISGNDCDVHVPVHVDSTTDPEVMSPMPKRPKLNKATKKKSATVLKTPAVTTSQKKQNSLNRIRAIRERAKEIFATTPDDSSGD